MPEDAIKLLTRYYTAFNAGDMETFLNLLSEDVIHDINQGERQIGKAAFQSFMETMNRCYREEIVDPEFMVNSNGSRASAEFIVNGMYLTADEGLPPADGQSYRLPAGTFFEFRDGKIARVTNYYNLQEWLRQVGE